MREVCCVGLEEFKIDMFIMGIEVLVVSVGLFIFSMGCWFLVLMNMVGSWCVLCISVDSKFLLCNFVLVFVSIVDRFIVLCVWDGMECVVM